MNQENDLMRLVSGARPSVLDLEDDGALRDRVRRAALTAAPARPRSAARRLSWRRGLLQRTPGIALVAGAAAGIAMVVLGASAVGPALGHRFASPTPALPSTASIGRGMLAAFRTDESQVLELHTTDTVVMNGTSSTGESDEWWSPSVAHAGQELRHRELSRPSGAQPVDRAELEVVRPGSDGPPWASMAAHKGTVLGEIIVVDYASRTWSDRRDVPVEILQDPYQPNFIGAELSGANHFRVVGRSVVGGQSAIELEQQGPMNNHVERLWVSERTYLPLRSTVQSSYTAGGVRVTTSSETEYRFLSPTAANLAKLQPVVPPGFLRTAAPPPGGGAAGG